MSGLADDGDFLGGVGDLEPQLAFKVLVDRLFGRGGTLSIAGQVVIDHDRVPLIWRRRRRWIDGSAPISSKWSGGQ